MTVVTVDCDAGCPIFCALCKSWDTIDGAIPFSIIHFLFSHASREASPQGRAKNCTNGQ